MPDPVPAIPDLFSRVTDVAPDRAPATADRGVGAPALYTARDAVRHEAVQYGSSDPDSEWVRRRMRLNPRNRTEHLAIGSGEQNEMFAFTPGTRAVSARAAEAAPYVEYYDHWWKRRDVDASERDHFAMIFARAHQVAWTKTDRNTIATNVAIAGYVFEASGGDLYAALDALAYTVRGGPAKAARPATPTPSVTDAITRARAALPEAERARRDAYSHFMTRRIALGRVRDKHMSMTISERDRLHAATLGVTPPEGPLASDITAIAEFFHACAKKTQDLEDAAWFGLTRELLPGEALERTTARVEQVERYQNDRYIDRPERVRPSDAPARERSVPLRSTEPDPTVDLETEAAAPPSTGGGATK